MPNPPTPSPVAHLTYEDLMPYRVIKVFMRSLPGVSHELLKRLEIVDLPWNANGFWCVWAKELDNPYAKEPKIYRLRDLGIEPPQPEPQLFAVSDTVSELPPEAVWCGGPGTGYGLDPELRQDAQQPEA
jgi:hypothetical protein